MDHSLPPIPPKNPLRFSRPAAQSSSAPLSNAPLTVPISPVLLSGDMCPHIPQPPPKNPLRFKRSAAQSAPPSTDTQSTAGAGAGVAAHSKDQKPTTRGRNYAEARSTRAQKYRQSQYATACTSSNGGRSGDNTGQRKAVAKAEGTKQKEAGKQEVGNYMNPGGTRKDGTNGRDNLGQYTIEELNAERARFEARRDQVVAYVIEGKIAKYAQRWKEQRIQQQKLRGTYLFDGEDD